MLDRLEAERLDGAPIDVEDPDQHDPDRTEGRKARPAVRWKAADAREDGRSGAAS